MPQVQIEASQQRCWELLSQPQHWHEWAPWLPIDVQNPGKGSRIKSRFGGIPLPGKITAWQPCWCWAWRWGTLTWRHQVDAVDEHTSIIRVELSGPGSGLVDVLYGPVMSLALRRLQDLAEAN